MNFIEGFVYVTGPFLRNFFFGLLLRLLLHVIFKGIQLLADRFICTATSDWTKFAQPCSCCLKLSFNFQIQFNDFWSVMLQKKSYVVKSHCIGKWNGFHLMDFVYWIEKIPCSYETNQNERRIRYQCAFHVIFDTWRCVQIGAELGIFVFF